jgi:hypothetical protein
MANVLLTTRCNLRCAYCFAQERLLENRNQAMTVPDAAKVIAFLKRSDHPIFRAMGGEPTLHPEFPVILQMALAEGMRVDLLSNATWSESCNTLFGRISPRRLFFLLNIDHPQNYLPRVWQRIERNLAAIAGRGSITLSFNIFEMQPRYEYLLDLLRTYQIKNVRLSFSIPVVGIHNAHLSLEECRQMGPFVVQFVRQTEPLGVEVRMDNAFPLCIFNDQQTGELLTKGVFDLKRNARCEPVIDIGPDLSVWCCFCLSSLWNRRLDEFENLQEMEVFYRQAMGRYQDRLYPLDECYQCRHRKLWGCQGGCLSYAILKHGDIASREADQPAAPDAWRPGTVLALAPDVEIQHYDLPDDSYAVHKTSSGLEMEVDGSFRSLLELLDGTRSANEVVDRFVENSSDSRIRDPLAQLTAKAMHQGAHDLLSGLRHQGFVEERPCRPHR